MLALTAALMGEAHAQQIRLLSGSPSPQNMACVEIGNDFMLSHDHIKNGFDVQQWTAPKFLQHAAKETAGGRMEEALTGYAGRMDGNSNVSPVAGWLEARMESWLLPRWGREVARGATSGDLLHAH
jgi:hypothetical protein